MNIQIKSLYLNLLVTFAIPCSAIAQGGYKDDIYSKTNIKSVIKYEIIFDHIRVDLEEYSYVVPGVTSNHMPAYKLSLRVGDKVLANFSQAVDGDFYRPRIFHVFDGSWVFIIAYITSDEGIIEPTLIAWDGEQVSVHLLDSSIEADVGKAIRFDVCVVGEETIVVYRDEYPWESQVEGEFTVTRRRWCEISLSGSDLLYDCHD